MLHVLGKAAFLFFGDYPGQKEFYEARRSQANGHLSMEDDAMARKRALESIAKWLHRPG